MANWRGEGETPTTTVGVITYKSVAAPYQYGLAYGGRVFEAADPNAIAPAVGNKVLADWLPGASQWIVVATVP